MTTIFSSSIGKKLVMSLSGFFLMMFLVVHAVANVMILFGEESYNAACNFMDTNPVIQIMVPVLAFGVFIHVVYAVYLTLTNRYARGAVRYAVPNKGKASSWASRNMFVLGLIIFGFLCLHLFHFWAKMQLQHFIGGEAEANPYGLVKQLFQNPLYCLIYWIWLSALWFHLSHGCWSAFQTIGMNNSGWIKRWKLIALIYATIIVPVFALVPIWFLLGFGG